MGYKSRVYYLANNELSIVIPAPKSKRIGESEQDWLERVYAKAVSESQKRLDATRFNLLFEQQKSMPNPKKLTGLAKGVEWCENTLLVGKEFDDKTDVDYPSEYNDENREKLRGEKGQPLRIDNTVVTQAEKRKTVEDELDAELAKQSPSAVKAIKLNRKLEKKDF